MVDLLSGEWLNDEIANSFSKLINQLPAEVLGRKFIFPSSFMSKLLNVSPTGKTGRYQYSNVKKFSKRWVPGKDIFKLDTLLFTINHQLMHWLTVEVSFTEKTITAFDSRSEWQLHPSPALP